MSVFDLSGRNALVCGGSRGIGADIARLLGQSGANVAVWFRSRQAEADAVVAELRGLGRSAVAFKQDLEEIDELPGAVARTVEEFGPIDVLVNNAAIADLVPVSRVTPELMQRTLQVNVMAPFFVSQVIAGHMVERGKGGRIINITSTNGFVGEALLAPYNASKGAMEMLT
ncbi:MAG: SDR family NAD(P)-dependent oxidoreductase [Lentisphaerae bacterium]|nr:SDR family NAD(P)-dependent oxidoreductase [Lentisphaerota bacterium]